MSTTLGGAGYGSNPSRFESKKLSSNFPIGIELEVEGSPNLENLASTFWTTTSDGSLRNGGVEIVARRGLSGVKLEKAVENLSATLKGTSVSLSERCSTHMHLDVTDMTGEQILNLLCLSVVFEHAMFNLFGEGRGSNNFCLTTDCGTGNYASIVEGLSAENKLVSILDRDWSKYAAVGLYRIRDLGTVEYRMFEPLTTEAQMTRAIEFLYALKREAMSIDNPQDIINDKKVNTLQGLFDRLFQGENYNEEREADLERGVQVLNDILTAVEVVKQVNQQKEKFNTLIRQAREQMSEIERGI